jgi:hypothetical protein
MGPSERPRNIELERKLTADAAKDGGGVGPIPDRGLSKLAEDRAWPGGLRPGVDWRREAQEEMADCRNYLVWEIEALHDAYEAREPWACDRMAQNMNALIRLTQAWRELLV